MSQEQRKTNAYFLNLIGQTNKRCTVRRRKNWSGDLFKSDTDLIFLGSNPEAFFGFGPVSVLIEVRIRL